MKQLMYVVRYLLKGRGNSLIKIISLTLGLVVGLVLFSQIAFERSYDNFYPDKDRIYRIQRIILSDEKSSEDNLIYTPMPRAMMDDVKGVEYATLTGSATEEVVFIKDDRKYTEKMLHVDEHFFDVFQLKILAGDIEKLALPYQVFISRSASERMFGKRNPVGELLLYNQFNYKKIPVTIAGVFEDVPANSSFDLDILLSIQTVFKEWKRQPGWLENDNYVGYVKLQPDIKLEDVDAQIPEMLTRYIDSEILQKRGYHFSFYLKPITDLHKNDPEVKKLLLILGILAFSLLFVAVMNYVLISISSLVKRSKQVAVCKTFGAGNGSIFFQFLLETFVLILVSLLLSVLLIFVFRGTIEELIQAPVSAVFAPQNLWVTLVLIVFLIIMAGVIPARIFSTIPATQVFRTAAINKRYWKNILLFVQFVSITGMCSMLFIIVRQYNLMINKDLGYTTENVLFVKLMGVPDDRINMIKEEFGREPFVEQASISTDIPIYGMCGDVISDPETRKNLFFYKAMGVDNDFLETLQIRMVSGENFEKDGNTPQDVLVNETFIEKMKDVGFSPDKTFMNGLDGEKRIVGVVGDFQLWNFYRETEPVMICLVDPVKGIWWGTKNYLVVRLKEYSPKIFKELNRHLLSLTGNDCLEFRNYKQVWRDEYREARLFRNSVIVSSLIMLLITILGLIGYVEDEITRRNKEIAIRKINGASVQNILYIISKDFLYIVMPAMLIGIMISYIMGDFWLQQFVVKVSLGFSLFASSCILLLAILFACICIRSWRVANENPVSSIQVE